jgi:hypothetical protein
MDLKPSKDNELIELYTQRYSTAMAQSKEFKKRLKKYRTLSKEELGILLDEIINLSQKMEESTQCLKILGCVDILLKILGSSLDEEILDKTSSTIRNFCRIFTMFL